MKSLNQSAFAMGQKIGCIAFGVDPSELPSRMAKEATLQSPEGEPFQRELCKIAYASFVASENARCPEAILFKNLSETQEWSAGYNRFADCVRRGLAKQANGFLAGGALLADSAKGGNTAATVLAGSGLTGAAVGSLAFLLSRNAQQSSAENAALLEKVKTYKKLSRDISEDMQRKGVMDNGGQEERYAV